MSVIINSFARFTVKENVQRAKSILKKKNVDPQDEDYQIIRSMLSAKIGWVGLFTYLRYEAEEPSKIDELATLFDKMMSVEALLKKLPQDIDKYTDIEKLNDAIDRLILNRTVNRFYQELTARLKEGFKAMNEEQRDRLELLLPSFYEKVPQGAQKKWFESMKKFKTFEALVSDLDSFVEGNLAAFTIEQVTEMVEDTNGGAKIIYLDEKKKRMVVRILTFEASALLNSSTAWCIRNSPGSWRTYISDYNYNCQYTIYDFKRRASDIASMIGLTIREGQEIKEVQYKNNTEVGNGKFMRTMKSWGIWDLLRPIEGEEKEEKEAASEFTRSLAYVADESGLPAYIAAFKAGMAKYTLTPEALEKVLRMGLRFANDELVNLALNRRFLPELSSTASADLMNYCLMTEESDYEKEDDASTERGKYLPMLLKAGLTLEPTSGFHYARFMLFSNRRAELYQQITKQGSSNFQTLNMVVGSGDLDLWKWYEEQALKQIAAMPHEKRPPATVLTEWMYMTLNTYSGTGTVMIKTTTFEMLQALSPYLTKLVENQNIFRTFYSLHRQDLSIIKLITQLYPSREEDVLGNGIDYYNWQNSSQTYVNAILAEGYSSVNPRLAAKLMQTGDKKQWEAIFSSAEKRRMHTAHDPERWESWEINPESWVVHVLAKACEGNAFEAVKYLHERGFKIEGKVVHNFSELLRSDDYAKTLSFKDTYGSSDIDPQMVYYMYRLGYDISYADRSTAMSQIEPEEEDYARFDAMEFASVVVGKLDACVYNQDYEDLAKLIARQYPAEVPIELIVNLKSLFDKPAMIAKMLVGRINVASFESGGRWTSTMSQLLQATYTLPRFYKSIRGWEQVTDLDVTMVLGAIYQKIDGTPSKSQLALVQYLIGFIRRNGVVSPGCQLGLFTVIKEGGDPMLLKQLLGTSEELAMEALIQSSHMYGDRLPIFNTLAFAGKFTLSTMQALVEHLRWTQKFNQRPDATYTEIRLDNLMAIVKLRRTKGDYTSLLPLLEKQKVDLSAKVYAYMVKLLGGVASEAIIQDFASFNPRF